MHKFKKVIFSSIAILSLSAAVSPITSVFAEGDETRPQTELTAGKEGDKDKTVSKNDQALTDNGKNEKKPEPKKEEPKEEPKKEKLPEAGFETVGLSFAGLSAAGLGLTQVAKIKARKKDK